MQNIIAPMGDAEVVADEDVPQTTVTFASVKRALAREFGDDVAKVITDVAYRFATSPYYSWEVHEFTDLVQECSIKFLAVRQRRDFLLSANPKGYLYQSLKNHLTQLHIRQQECHVDPRVMARDIAELVVCDGGIGEKEDDTVWEEFLSGLSIAERYTFAWKLAGFTWGEIASRLTAVSLGSVAAAHNRLRTKEVEDGRYLFRAEIRTLRITPKQARGNYSRVLKKMKRFAVKRNITAWLRYIEG